ncbi:MAG: hypothetical protein ACI4PL_08180 [Faecousia sp.]
MEKRAKMGWNALRILGIVYAILGGVFLAVGAVIFFLGDADLELKIVGGVFVLIGGIFGLLGGIFLAVEYGKRKRADRLIASGRYIWGQVVDCQMNYNVRVKGRSPVIFVVKYVDGRGVSHIFRSHGVNTYRDPDYIGKQVKVYVSDDSFRHYYVDAETLLPNTVEH